MISLELDRHDFVSAVEGFAHGSHLRQHVWRDIVYRSIPQMTDDEMDYFWYIFRRNLWECYFRERDGKTVCECGSEDYLHVSCRPASRQPLFRHFPFCRHQGAGKGDMLSLQEPLSRSLYAGMLRQDHRLVLVVCARRMGKGLCTARLARELLRAGRQGRMVDRSERL